jgi:hypothetical protein
MRDRTSGSVVRGRRRGLAACLSLNLVIVACSIDNRHLSAFECDIAARDPHCGTDRDGQPLTCFPASQLDGIDFCTPSCGEPMSLPDEAAVCVGGSAKLASCHPDDTTSVDGPCGRSDLGCLRTDVTTDEGVCLTMQPCTRDSDCPNPVRTSCAATFLNELYAKVPPSGDPRDPYHSYWRSDHLYCLQRGCKAGGTNCAPGQSCLPVLVAAAAQPPDICVPNCDSQDRCPPNQFCWSKLSGPGSPHVCLPGLLGFLCESDIDCVVGKCVSDNEPDEALRLNLCTLPCQHDDECARYDSDQGRFVCVLEGSGAGRCATPDAYRGARCFNDGDCTRDEGTKCVFSSRPISPGDQGTCSRLCPSDGSPCTPRGGFGHVCLDFTVAHDGSRRPGCYPGYFGLPCTADDQCVGDLKCATVVDGGPKICTALCQSDDDCAGDRWVVDSGNFCTGTVCAPKLTKDAPCAGDNQCGSNSCVAGKCV